MTEKISAHRILAELKTLEGRINTATRESFISYYVGDEGVPSGFKTKEEFTERAKAKYQSVQDLITRRNKLKKALIHSNAVTIITVAGIEMTVAEAIEQKDSIDYKKNLLSWLRNQYSNTINRFEGELQVLNNQVNKRIEDAGGKDRKITSEDEEQIIKMSKKRYEPHILDPINIAKEIEDLQDYISAFELDVDTALSESNARVEIEII